MMQNSVRSWSLHENVHQKNTSYSNSSNNNARQSKPKENLIIFSLDMVLFIALIVLFSADATLHIWSRYKNNILLGNVTKLFLIPLIYFPVVVGASVFRIPIVFKKLFYLMIVFYWLGDTMMILKAKRKIYFYLGAFSFLLGHISLSLYFVLFGYLWWLFLLSLLAFGFVYYCFIRHIKKSKAYIEFTYAFYGLVLLLLAICLTSSYSNSNWLSWLFRVVGVILFGLSDSKIAYKKLGMEKTSEVFIMSTYISANVLFALSIWFINAPYQIFIH